MSHRKFSAPRHGSLGYLPRKRCRRGRGRVKTFPADISTKKPHLTSFMGYKAGMTHVTRLIEKRGSVLHNTEIVDAASVIDTPPMVVVGIVGYVRTPTGIRALTTVWASHISDSVRRRYYKRWFAAKQKAFTKYTTKVAEEAGHIEQECARMVRYCNFIRVIAASQPQLAPIGAKKAQLLEIQINGGSIADKVEFSKNLLEKEIHAKDVFSPKHQVDVIGITKGHGMAGVVSRWGVTKLPRKTRRGNRKVACIGAWHPANVQFSVARVGQKGFFHRTEKNKQIFHMSSAAIEGNASTEHDLSKKTINPMGNFPHYGKIQGDYMVFRGGCVGVRKRPIIMRHALLPLRNLAPPGITWISTSSKLGHGHFETPEEKKRFFARK
eukprot:gnl/Dysnectes_brevis/135_a160_9289.p1 GENE.gnl/Dysnectes_brevis/135_a160_9289~~gnl/Dysnectes_brevis/135_a160_9289.p1  ORF type:complete len:381 (+),score=120.24 gnl/Dysnectes_brevis/135_a160_9289:49-1191(+)